MRCEHYILFAVATVLMSCPSAFARAREIEYFSSGIDFWGKTERSEKEAVPQVIPVHQPEPKPKPDFDWKKHLDPNNAEFFREGDYSPPEPFMEVARNPSDQNLKNWFEYMRKKNELAHRLQTRMAEYVAKSGLSPSDPLLGASATSPVPVAAHPVAASTEGHIDTNRFRFRMYFDSKCPHCKRMFGTLEQLQRDGFSVEARQVDNDTAATAGLPVPSHRATADELKQHQIESVPVLIIADVKRQGLLPAVRGYQGYGEVLQLLRVASSK